MRSKEDWMSGENREKRKGREEVGEERWEKRGGRREVVGFRKSA